MNEKTGFSLLEVLLASALVGVIFIGCSTFFVNAYRIRKMARLEMSATIQATSLMERAFQASNPAIYNQVSGFFDSDNGMSYSSTDPSCMWVMDGDTHSSSVEYTQSDVDDLITIDVTINYGENRNVVLSSERYCE